MSVPAECVGEQVPVSRLDRESRSWEWAGALSALLGAALIASNTGISGWGFVLFLVSNVCLMRFGDRIGGYGLVAMQAGFVLVNLIGIVRWLL